MKKSAGIFCLLFIVFLPRSAGAQEWNPNLEGCTEVLERFFFEGIENTSNLRRFYVDGEGRWVLSSFLNKDGTERSRSVFRYDDRGERVEYSLWDRSGAGWDRWWHSLVETSEEDGLTVYTERTVRYEEPERVTRIVKRTGAGTVVYEAEYGYDGSSSVREFNEHGDVANQQYENEKSDGLVSESFEYVYEDGLPVSVERIRGGVSVETTTNVYRDGLLVRSSVRNRGTGEISEIEYEYDSGKLSRKRWLDPKGKARFELYYEYDGQGRMVRQGEKSESYERYWLYEYGASPAS